MINLDNYVYRGKQYIGIKMLDYMWGKRYPPKWGINLFAKGDGFAI